jgi:RNA polymerase sigma factor (sigma-70 family)
LPRRPDKNAGLSDAYFASIARSVGVPPFWLDDCLQEIHLRLWKKQRTTPEVSASLAGVIARRTAIDFMRWAGRRRGKQAATVTPFSELSPEDANEPPVEIILIAKDGDIDTAGRMVDLRTALATMQYREREIIVLSVLYGFASWRIGEQLGISSSRVQQLRARAIVKVRRFISDFDIGSEANGDVPPPRRSPAG